MTRQRPNVYLLQGGLDTETPAIAVRPGSAIDGYNYEPTMAGYRRIGGYERFDGAAIKPSEAVYHILSFDAGTVAITASQPLQGASSGSLAIALADAVLESGTWAGGDAAGYVPVLLYADFTDNENIEVSGSPVAVVDGAAVQGGADSDTDDATWSLAAKTMARGLIAKPAGSGPVRGVVGAYGTAYCWRDNAGETAGVFYKALLGWQAQDAFTLIEFDAGTAEILPAQTLTGGTSSATATVERVIVESGTWAGGDAAGYILLDGVTGTFQDNEAITTSGGAAVAASTAAAQTFPTGGRYVFARHQFFPDNPSLFMTSGEGPALEYNGFSLAPIRTGLSDAFEKPTRCAVFREHLFLFYRDGTVQFAETGEPFKWSTTGGAGQFKFGEEPVDVVVTKTAMVIFGLTSIKYLAGNDSADFELLELSRDSGAREHSVQMIDTPYYYDGGNIQKLTSTQALGGWNMGSVAPQCQKYFSIAKSGTKVVGSFRRRKDNHYVVMFSDKTGVVAYLGRERSEIMPVSYPFQTFCVWSGEASLVDQSPDETVLVGTDDGWVYELDKGFDFDGGELTALLVLGFISPTNAFQKDRYHSAHIGVTGGVNVTFSISAEFDYGGPYEPITAEIGKTFSLGGARWNEANWNEFYWSGQGVDQGEATLDGVGMNCSVAFRNESTNEPQHTLQWMSLHTTPRKIVR